MIAKTRLAGDCGTSLLPHQDLDGIHGIFPPGVTEGQPYDTERICKPHTWLCRSDSAVLWNMYTKLYYTENVIEVSVITVFHAVSFTFCKRFCCFCYAFFNATKHLHLTESHDSRCTVLCKNLGQSKKRISKWSSCWCRTTSVCLSVSALPRRNVC